MRNLKKILALVLALVMSLSLMATASATDFKDDDQFNESYKTAAEVLAGLKVLVGDPDGSFRPTDSITRAEAAAAVYRIVTGDVEDKQVSIYADYNIFTDVQPGDWYAGYVNFCANAEYIKGNGDGTFSPNEKVTGYAALAMILRAIGYTANGGFTGDDWHIQAARTAEARKITKNIMTGTLGEDARRETVAEILFQAILVNMVNHNQDHTYNGQQGYFETDETLGYKIFKLEQIEGVVVANEYANLNGPRVIGKDKTDLQVADEENPRRLAIGTKITDIGESRYAYVTGSKVLAMGDTGLNKVTETGKAVDIGSASKFAAVAEMPAASDIEYYTNFDPNIAGHYYCDQRLEFSVVFYGKAAEDAFDAYKGIDISEIAAADDEWSVEVNTGTVGTPVFTETELNTDKTDYKAGNTTPAYNYPVRYTKIIWAGNDITNTDLAVLESIFGAADNKNNNVLADKRITGDVFVGTKSTNSEVTDEERDLSNSISYKKFFDEYIIANGETNNWSVTWNGWWTKFVDNDGDGAAEYAFRTNYSLEKALYTYTDRDGNTYLEFNDFDDENWTVRYLDDYTPAIGDKVLAAYIDGQMLVEPANSETVVVSSYSWRNDEVTTDKGTYGQSGIINATNMMELISTMEDKVEYIVYFDHFGYIRAYELPGGTKYALITEMYYTNGNQGNVVKDWPMTAELTTLDDEGKTVTDEYNVVGGAGTFTAVQPWMRVENAVATYNYNNWVQPAIAHLGVTRQPWNPTKGTPDFTATVENSGDTMASNAYSTFWNANRQLVRNINTNGMNGVEEFNYGAQTFKALYKTLEKTDYNWNVEATASFTNVAIVNINGDDASLTGAATLNLDKNAKVVTEQPYATDYIQLSTGDIAAQAVRYNIGGSNDYKNANNTYVNAVHDTQYFIAYNGGVISFKDYVNFPGLNNKENRIHAAYAVARNTNSDLTQAPYWVADVIVYEVYDLVDNLKQTSVSLAFYTPTRTSGNVQEIETLNSKYGPEVTLIPGERAWSADRGQWGAEWEGYGFYGLFNDSAPVDNVMAARDIDRIGAWDTAKGDYEHNYAKNNIHAGIITREAYIDGAGEYIDVSLGNNKSVSIEITNKIYSVTEDQWNQSDNWYGINYANLLRYENQTNSQVRKGDCVIWVGDAKTNGTKSATNFVVDLGSARDWSKETTAYCGVDLLDDTADFLIQTYVDSNGDLQISSYADGDITSKSGEWQKIMNEQGATVPTDTINITFKFTSADPDFPGKDDVTETVPKTTAVTYDLTKAPFTIEGWNADATSSGVEVKNAAGTVLTAGSGVYTWTSSKLALAATTTTGNLTVTVKYTATTTSFTADTAGSTPAGSAFDYKLATDAWDTDATSAKSTLADGSTAIPYGAAFELRINETDVDPLYTYTASVTGGTLTSPNPVDDGNGNLVWSGKITGTTVVTVAETKKTNLVTIALSSNEGTEWTASDIADNDEVVVGSEIKFQAAAETGYVITKVSYEVIGGTASGTLTENADGDYVIPATATTPANSTVSITVECVSTSEKTFSLKSDGTKVTTAAINYVVKDREGTLVASGIIDAGDTSGADVDVQAGYTIELTSSEVFKAKTTSAITNPSLATATAATGSAAPYTMTLTVTDASANATITLGGSTL